MNGNTEQITSTWIFEYLTGFDTFMWKYYPAQYAKVHLRYIIPPQRIGGRIQITKSSKLSEIDYEKLTEITDDFCNKYCDPKNFPDVWQ